MKRRGLSDIVTNVIIIALALVAITVVWIVVQNVLSSNADSIEVQQKCLGSQFEVKGSINDSAVKLNVQRLSGSDTLSGFYFYIYNSTEDLNDSYSGNILVGQVIYKTFFLEKINRISVVPYIEKDSKIFYCSSIEYSFVDGNIPRGFDNLQMGVGEDGGDKTYSGGSDSDGSNTDETNAGESNAGENPSPITSPIVSFSSETTSCSEWKTFGRNLNNTRYSPCSGPENISSGFISYQIGEGVIMYNSPVIFNGYLYILSSVSGINPKTILYQLNSSNLEYVNNYIFLGSADLYHTPAIAGDYIFVGVADKMYKLNLSSLNLVEVYTISSSLGDISRSPIVFDKTVFFQSTSGTAYLLNYSNFSNNPLVSSAPNNQEGQTKKAFSPTVIDGKIYSGGNQIIREFTINSNNSNDVSANTGITNLEFDYSSIIGYENLLYFRAAQRSTYSVVPRLYTFNFSSGASDKEYLSSSSNVDCSMAFANGKLYLNNYDQVFMFDTETKTMISSRVLGYISSSLSIAIDRIYFSTYSGGKSNFYELNITDLSVLNNQSLKNASYSSPIIVDGYVYTADTKNVYRLG